MIWIIGSWGWLSSKCFLYDKTIHYWLSIHSSSCPHSNLTAVCLDVCDLNLSLSIVSSNYQALCLEIRSGSVMQSGAVCPRFYYIYCVSQCYNSSLLSTTFSDLINLEELSIENYRLSVMALDALGGIPLLRKLTVNTCTQEHSDFLCSIVNMSNNHKTGNHSVCYEKLSVE
uniref:Uncharacterized protein n=1 Tax=Hucho hucho TaxID=62062 RepID=A0A4W5KP83_9TELE